MAVAILVAKKRQSAAIFRPLDRIHITARKIAQNRAAAEKLIWELEN
jgi:hypothetical protein